MRALLLLIASAAFAGGQVKIEQQADRISIEVEGKPFTEFFFGGDATKPYLHPLRSASGKTITRQYPMAEIAGESHDHPHHRGLYFAHGDVNGIDFWGNEPSQQNGKKGTIRLSKVVRIQSGEKSGSVQASFHWIDPQGKVLLTENREMIFYSDPANRTIDLDIKLTAAENVTFGDTKEGTLAIRLASEMEEPTTKSLSLPKRTGLMTNSEGATTEKECWGERAPWMDYAGQVDGEDLGIAIFDHPANPNHPTFWHARAYGLFAANPFGAHDFTNGNSPSGAMPLERGKTIRFRYRVLIHPGKTQMEKLAKAYAEYAK